MFLRKGREVKGTQGEHSINTPPCPLACMGHEKAVHFMTKQHGPELGRASGCLYPSGGGPWIGFSYWRNNMEIPFSLMTEAAHMHAIQRMR